MNVAGNFWHTDTVAVQTPRGVRYQGLAVAGPHRRHGEDVRYRSRLHIHENDAYEAARSRVIHHNIWHDETPDAARVAHLHHAPDCHERAVAL